MRAANDHPCKGGGYWYPFLDAPGGNRQRRGVRVAVLNSGRPKRDGIPELAESYRRAVIPHLLDALADALGVTAESLNRLGVGLALDDGRDGGTDAGDVARLNLAAATWAFPMKLGRGDVVGIRLRAGNGRKWSVAGGREGLFIPADLPKCPAPLLIAEGPTDTAALLSMGLSAIGRPSCTGAVSQTVRLVQRLSPRSIAIVADADAPGRRGAHALGVVLAVYTPSVRIIEPPAGIKDVRAWRQQGATAADLMAAVHSAPAFKATISMRA
jgi:hypothetical protein